MSVAFFSLIKRRMRSIVPLMKPPSSEIPARCAVQDFFRFDQQESLGRPGAFLDINYHGQSRSRSFRLVFARVCASTRLTITAQLRLYLPSSLCRLPDTTTDPTGMRP